MNVAHGYRVGRGVEKNLFEAYRWHTIAMYGSGEISRQDTASIRAKYADELPPDRRALARQSAIKWIQSKGQTEKLPVPDTGMHRAFPTEKISRQEWISLLHKAKRLPERSIIPLAPNGIVIETPYERALYFFTASANPAHPAAIVWRVVKERDKLGIEINGYFAGSERQFRRLLAFHRKKRLQGDYISIDEP